MSISHFASSRVLSMMAMTSAFAEDGSTATGRMSVVR